MTHREQMLYIAVILELLAAVPNNSGVPSGHVYAGLMGRMNLDQYNAIVNAVIAAGLIAKDGMHVLTLTAEGLKTTRNLAVARAAATSEPS